MTVPPPVRPPPTAAALDVPADFDAGMTERWHAWQARGRAGAARGRAQGLMALAGVGLMAAAVVAATALLAR